jgi:hypothetical protein
MQVIDMYWIVRPFVYGNLLGQYLQEVTQGQTPSVDPVRLPALLWLDIAGVVGPLGLLFGLLFRRAASGPLIPINDPRLAEAINHRNYV